MIEILSNPTRQELHAISQAEFAAIIEEMLTNYMTQTTVAHSKGTIHLLAQKMTECSPMPASNLGAKL